MALDFPASPTDGQVFGAYVWSASKSVWQAKPQSATVATTSSAKPTTPNNGDIWIDTSDGIAYFYYDDGTSAQWVEVMSSGVPSLASKANVNSPTFSGTVSLPSTTSIGNVSNIELSYVDGVTSAIQTQINEKASLSGANFTGGITSSFVGSTTHFSATNTSSASDQYNMILAGVNDTGTKAIHFVNSSTRTTDGGANAYTIRNDAGILNLGNSNYETNIYGKVTMPQQPAYYGSINGYTSTTSNFFPVTSDTFNVGFSKSGNNRLTAQVAGKYYVAAQQLINNTGNVLYLNIMKNGTTIAHAYANGDDTYDMNVSALVSLAVNDYIEIYYSYTLTYAWGGGHSSYSVFKVS